METYGRNIVHHTWKDENIPKQRRHDYDSWAKYHPEGVLRVFWTDTDNQNLIDTFYPEFSKLYSIFELTIQKVDTVRFALSAQIWWCVFRLGL